LTLRMGATFATFSAVTGGPRWNITHVVIFLSGGIGVTGDDLQTGRRHKGWSQQEAAPRLGVSQPYLSLLERGARPVPEKLARKAAAVFGLSATALPLDAAVDCLVSSDSNTLAKDLAALGYPGLSYLGMRRRRKNPAEVLLSGLSASDLEARLVEALPWLAWKFPEMDWRWLTRTARLGDLQNRLAFVTSVARCVADKLSEREKAELLAQRLVELEPSRLAREDTLCRQSLTEAERRWLRTHRSPEAKHWNLLTDLSAEHLGYAA
jgi:transcriptional regulator with XRE-family HTH domain